MKPTTRLATAAAGVALAACAVAGSGTAAFAAKPGGGTASPQPLPSMQTIPNVTVDGTILSTEVRYDVPEPRGSVTKTSCLLDSQPVACNEAVMGQSRGVTTYSILVDATGLSSGWHTFGIQVTTKKATYEDSMQVGGSGN